MNDSLDSEGPQHANTHSATSKSCLSNDPNIEQAAHSTSVAHPSVQTQRTAGTRGTWTRRVAEGRKVGRTFWKGRVRRSNRFHEPLGEVAGKYVSEGKIQFVLAGQPTGWTAMAHAVRTFDEEKVKDCKEDVDTLLVFAGLFSAVLTAFLIESYKNLIEDPATQTLFVIKQLVAQTSSYRFDGGMLNSTTTPSPLPQFRVSKGDIRVNVLWFASLLFSLITASFGILVKQWLREFLAAENPSPQARLRVRHLRYPQLGQWKVFEIAAVLPLLLQLALALFFAGLCYFTAAVHSSVEYTTLPLVFGWLFCFCTVTIMPIFFPRCPYRTALLRGLLQSFHRSIGHMAKMLATSCTKVLQSRSPLKRWKKTMLTAIGRHLERASSRLVEQDETRVMRQPESDINILASVDSIQSDDELLGTAIAEAVDHIRCKPSIFEDFVRTILENRGHPSGHAVAPYDSRTPACIVPFPIPILDLRLVSKQARNAIGAVVSHYATNSRFDAGQIITNPRMVRFDVYKTILMCMIMLSVSDCPLPDDGLYIIHGPQFHVHGCRAIIMLIREALDTVVVGYETHENGHNISEDKPQLLLQGVGQLWSHFDAGLFSLLRIVHDVAREYGGFIEDDLRLPEVPATHVDGWAIDHLTPSTACDLLHLLMQGATSILRKDGAYKREDPDIHAFFRAVLRLSHQAGRCSDRLERAQAFEPIIAALLSRRDWTLSFVEEMLHSPWSSLRAFIFRFLDRMGTTRPTYAIDLDSFDWCTRLDRYTDVVSAKLSAVDSPISSEDALKLCYFATSLVKYLIPAQPPREKWVPLFNMLLDRIDSPESAEVQCLREAKGAIAEHMFSLICTTEIDGDAWTMAPMEDKYYLAWANDWREEDAIFPDRLIESIARHAPRTRMTRSWRVRRALEAIGPCDPVPISPRARAEDTLYDILLAHALKSSVQCNTPRTAASSNRDPGTSS